MIKATKSFYFSRLIGAQQVKQETGRTFGEIK
jgi:hypothetical protein